MGATVNVATLIQQLLTEFRRLNGRLDQLEKERALQLQSEAGIRIERNTFPIRDETSLELLEEKLKQPEFFKAMVWFFLTNYDSFFSCIFMFVLLLLLLNIYFSLGSIPGSFCWSWSREISIRFDQDMYLPWGCHYFCVPEWLPRQTGLHYHPHIGSHEG